MRAGFVVSGVLGLGTVLVFAFAALTATLFPGGTVIGNGMNGVVFDRGFRGGLAVPVPAPAIDIDPDVIIRVDPDIVAPNDFEPLPGDIVVNDVEVGPAVTPDP